LARRIITEETRKEMKKVLTEIQDGTFANRWLLENQINRPVFNATARRDEEHQMKSWRGASRHDEVAEKRK
jgi:ketol-acid reductoisomerase